MESNAKPCPNCGHCPTCGRSNLQPYTWPAYPWWVSPYVPIPQVPVYPTIIWTTTAFPNIGGAGNYWLNHQQAAPAATGAPAYYYQAQLT